MKKIIAIALALTLMATPASAITTGNWNIGAANQSAANAASKQWQEKNKPEVDTPCLPAWIMDLIHAWKWW